MNGKLLLNEKITGNQTSIVMSNLVPATYFVKVIQGSKEVKTFKIIKN
ncbi:MAG: T9SS type A sorting domain-containing protein [Salinivirgaceae bacterium]